MVTRARTRILLAKLGMDAHWRGIGVVARLLRDAGYEVIYIGHGTPDHITAAAIAEDVDLIGISSLSGNHLGEMRRLLDELGRRGVRSEIPVVLGGTIPAADAEVLIGEGVAAVFGPGTGADTILDRIGSITAPAA